MGKILAVLTLLAFPCLGAVSPFALTATSDPRVDIPIRNATNKFRTNHPPGGVSMGSWNMASNNNHAVSNISMVRLITITPGKSQTNINSTVSSSNGILRARINSASNSAVAYAIANDAKYMTNAYRTNFTIVGYIAWTNNIETLSNGNNSVSNYPNTPRGWTNKSTTNSFMIPSSRNTNTGGIGIISNTMFLIGNIGAGLYRLSAQVTFKSTATNTSGMTFYGKFNGSSVKFDRRAMGFCYMINTANTSESVSIEDIVTLQGGDRVALGIWGRSKPIVYIGKFTIARIR